MANYGVYVPYPQLKEYLSIPTDQTTDDKLLANFCIQASRKFDAHCHNRTFYPIKQTRYYDVPSQVTSLPVGSVTGYGYGSSGGGYIGYVNSPFPNPPLWGVDTQMLDLDDDLLEVTSLTTNNGEITLTSDDYYLMTGDKYNFPPYDRIVIKEDSGLTFSGFAGTSQHSNAVTGFWGYHEQYSQAWQDSNDTLTAGYTAGGTTLTVSDADGTDIYGFTPRFMNQQLIRVGSGSDAWLAYITGINTTTNVLTIIPGINGTTSVNASIGIRLYVYAPMPEIVGAMQALATYCYRRKDNVGKEYDRGSSAIGVVMMPAKLPADVTDILDTYKRWTKS